jgi:carbamoyltransferase
MYILGLAFGFHDASAALLKDSTIVAAAAEERFSRQKHDPGFPGQAIDFCLGEGGITGGDLDAVVLHEEIETKFDRIVHSGLTRFVERPSYLEEATRRWIVAGRFDAVDRVAAALSLPAERIQTVPHHTAHAASAFFASPFDTATVVTLDGVGEYEAMTVSIGRGNCLEKLYADELPQSLGLFYSAFTAYLGFEVNEGEYKVMGLAAFGEPRFAEKVRLLLRLEPGGHLSVDERFFEFLTPEDRPYTDRLIECFGPPRTPDSPFIPGDRCQPPKNDLELASRRYADIAASVQLVCEEAIVHVVEQAVRRTGVADVCLAGGVALNSLANGKLQRRLTGRLFVQPAAGDGGTSLGAALYHAHAVCRLPRRVETEPTALLGRDYTADDVKQALRRGSVRCGRTWSDEELVEVVASRLAEGAVVGMCRGRFEWGPRALGARSILANPTIASMQQVVNEKIKLREPFRPFAPAVLDDRASEFFEIREPYGLHSLEYFMLSIACVRPEQRSRIPAVTHVDGTARLQLVNRSTSPFFYRLIERFAFYTGVPVLLNTSFNQRGEPIVGSPWDALWTFAWSGLDLLAVGNTTVEKSELS